MVRINHSVALRMMVPSTNLSYVRLESFALVQISGLSLLGGVETFLRLGKRKPSECSQIVLVEAKRAEFSMAGHHAVVSSLSASGRRRLRNQIFANR